MSRSNFGAAFLFVAVVTILPGCMGGAKLVHQDTMGGIVSIPENTNVWPTYYRDAAYEKIRENYPNFDPRTDVVEQGEVVIGKQTHNDQRVDRRQVGPDGKPIGEVLLNSNTSTTTDVKEFHITYRMKPTLLGNGMNNGLQQTGGVAKPGERLPGNGLAPNTSGRPGTTGATGRTGMNNSSMTLEPVPGANLGSPTFGTR